MTAWKLTTDSYPQDEQRQAWREAMSRLCLPIGDIPDPRRFHGKVSCLVSPLGIEFAVVEPAALEISGRYPKQPPAIWLTLLLEGDAILIEDRRRIELSPGDILYGPTGVGATLKFARPFRQMFIKVPRIAVDPRFIAPLSVQLGHIRGQSGINHVFSGMLVSLAQVFDDIHTDELGPIELSLTEFLITCLVGERGPLSLGGAAGARAAHLHRICQTIETRLGEPDLNPAKVAEVHGVSQRYLQKLFTLAGKTFSSYLRARRLERCRADLVSPLFAQLSISEICFRWGFNGSSHFSRAFREQYGVSPREYRRSETRAGAAPHESVSA